MPSTPDCTVGDVIAGPKWTGLRTLLNDWQGWRDYDYIWLPDDDIFTNSTTIDRMFAIARALAFELCAPALHEASYYAHYSAMRNRRVFARSVGFVEIMMPCFSRRALEQLLPTLDLTLTGWGWGLDSLWPKLLDHRGLGVIDATPMLHTRPVGAFRDPVLERSVHAESDAIMAKFDCRQVHTTFGAFAADLRPLDLAPDALAVVLIDGWRYLFDANPALLPWIVDAMRPPGGWPDYPIAGTPTSAVTGDGSGSRGAMAAPTPAAQAVRP